MNRWVIIAPRRGNRPHDFKKHPKPEEKPGPCAFCLHHEHETGRELYASRDGGESQGLWLVRVVENLYPAVSKQGEYSDGVCVSSEGVFEGCKMPGFGSHEVVIETPDHDKVLAQLPPPQIEEIFKAYQSRIQHLRQDKRLKFVQVPATSEYHLSQVVSIAFGPELTLWKLRIR